MADRSEASLAIRRLAVVARRDLASMERSDASLAGWLAACALVAVAAIAAVLVWRWYTINPAGLPAPAKLLLAIALLVVGLAAGLTFVMVRRAVYAVETARNAVLVSRFKEHFSDVLYDQGLLALVLGNDPRFSVPSVAQHLGLELTQGQRGTVEAVASFSQRIELLLNCYGLLCRHYRIEPYPADNPFASRGVFPVRLRGLRRRAMLFALEEGIGSSDADQLEP